MQGIREAVAELQQGPVKDAGLQLKQAYDETTYIDSAIDLVQRNIVVGGALAAFMLMLFLRSWRATTGGGLGYSGVGNRIVCSYGCTRALA